MYNKLEAKGEGLYMSTGLPGSFGNKKGKLLHRIWRARYIYLLLLPGLVYYIVFKYIPLSGIVMAFENYKARLGLWRSPWVGLDNFRRLFITTRAVNSIWNTLRISLFHMLINMPVPFMLALLLNELRMTKVKKLYQTIFTFPHFFSWIIISSLVINLLSTNGALNGVIKALGGKPMSFLASKSLARPLLYITSCWKEMGWDTIVYLAVISGIDPALYEAAVIDGATRTQRIRHVTIPAMKELLIVMIILHIGKLMNSGFDQIYNLRNDVTKLAVDTIDTYVYDITFGDKPNYSFSTAVSLFKSLVNIALLLISNKLSKAIAGQGVFK